MVIRESMHADLVDRLITDIVAVTERLMDSDPVDLSALQTGPTSIEQMRGRAKHAEDQKHEGQKSKFPKRLMTGGIHRGVC